MASTDPFGRGPHRPDVAQDYLDLFRPDAPWAEAGRQLTVFKVGPSFVDSAPDDVLRQAFSDLKRRGIALGWEMGAVRSGPDCGRGEGYAGDTSRSVGRIKAAGGELRYVAMDEPFWFGHLVQSNHACQLSIGDLARNVAERLSIVRAVFPNVQVGDIEPIGDPQVNDYVAEITEWAQEFRKATGRPLAFFHGDIDWNGPWRRDLPIMQRQLATLNIPIGVIINGDPFAKTDLQWTNAAVGHLQEVLDLAGIQPDAIIFQTWDDRPSKLLPENQPGSLTNLVLEETRPPAKIVVIPGRHAISGRVNDVSGKPVSDVGVELTARDIGGLYGLHTVERTGVVPADAASALFGLRVGIECDCVGPIDISIGQMQFHDGPADAIVRSLQSGADPYRLEGGTAVKVSINTAPFSVNAGAPYTVDVPLQVREQPNRAGYLALFFLGANGKEVRRDPIELKAANQILGKPVTDPAGQFSLTMPASLDASRLLIRAQVEANTSTRSTVLELRPGAH
jgi:hypothetical protein